MSEEETFVPLPAEWQTRQTCAITTFAYRGHRYTVSTIDLATAHNYELLQALADLRDALSPARSLPALRYETRVFVNGEAASMLKAVYESLEEALSGHQKIVMALKMGLKKEQQDSV